ncbi:MAG: cell division protein FtsW [Candidatus Vogelbacteria bacterium]|nr:cell division protein FtsW [Candidatus Vogelbacteria bacterium]
MKLRKPDRFLWILLLILITTGFFIFASASLGLVGRSGQASFYYIALKQALILLTGVVGMIALSNVPYKWWRQYAIYIALGALMVTCLVFIDQLNFTAGGARRWINLGPLTFQPAEFLKIAIIIYLAAWMATAKEAIQTWTGGFLPFLGILVIPATILYLQPNNSSIAIIAIAAFAMYWVAGAPWKQIIAFGLLGVLGLGLIISARPYVKERVLTFLDTNRDTQGSSWQINQSLIAVGSGHLTGRGFGQSVQKFNYLPEPMGDSIYAVAAEEFGFVGAVTLVIIFLLLALWGLKIASRINDSFGRLLAVGIVILITSQSFINISAMLGLVPLTGVPLLFVSQGGTALLVALLEAGLLLNLSRYQ